MGLPLKDREHHTYGDYLTWPEEVRYELIDGCAYLMVPAPDLAHQDVAGEIFRQGSQCAGRQALPGLYRAGGTRFSQGANP